MLRLASMTFAACFSKKYAAQFRQDLPMYMAKNILD